MQSALRWIVYLLLLAVAVCALVFSAMPELGLGTLAVISGALEHSLGRVAVASVGALVLIVQALLVLRWFGARRFAREIGYTNEFGRVAVSLVAIEEALTRAIEGEAGIRKVQVRVYEDRVKRTVIVEASLTMWESNNLTSTTNRCQEVLRRRFAELLPERNQVQVHLTLHRLNQRKKEDLVQGEALGAVPASTGGNQPARTKSGMPPALAAASGGVDEEAGAAVLKKAKTDSIASPKPMAFSEPPKEELDYENLYGGPTYPVDDDDEDEGPYGARP